LKINFKKCQFVKKSVQFLSHTVERGRIYDKIFMVKLLGKTFNDLDFDTVKIMIVSNVQKILTVALCLLKSY